MLPTCGAAPDDAQACRPAHPIRRRCAAQLASHTGPEPNPCHHAIRTPAPHAAAGYLDCADEATGNHMGTITLDTTVHGSGRVGVVPAPQPAAAPAACPTPSNAGAWPGRAGGARRRTGERRQVCACRSQGVPLSRHAGAPASSSAGFKACKKHGAAHSSCPPVLQCLCCPLLGQTRTSRGGASG